MKTLKSGLLILSLIFLMDFSCEQSDEIETLDCDVENPLEDLQWLKEIKDDITMPGSMTRAQIIQYTFHGENVFWVNICYDCLDGIISVRNCEGEVICAFGGIDGRNTCPDFALQAYDSTMLFDNTNKVCDVEDPLEDLTWLKEIKDVITMRMSPAGAQIIQYTYHGETVFWIDECYNCPDALVTLHNCEGVVICEFGGIDGRNTCPDFATEATDSTMLFDYVNH